MPLDMKSASGARLHGRVVHSLCDRKFSTLTGSHNFALDLKLLNLVAMSI